MLVYQSRIAFANLNPKGINMNSDSNKAFNISRPVTPTIKKPATETIPAKISVTERNNQIKLIAIPKMAEMIIRLITNGKQHAQNNK